MELRDIASKTTARQGMWFDGQAEQFDDSAGLEPNAGRSVAQAILKLTDCTDGDCILDVGAGTGAIGVHFAGQSSCYLGLDLSPPILVAAKGSVTDKLAGPATGEFYLVRESSVTTIRSDQSFLRTEQLPENEIAELARLSV